jgi:hypothetical protein
MSERLEERPEERIVGIEIEGQVVAPHSRGGRHPWVGIGLMKRAIAELAARGEMPGAFGGNQEFLDNGMRLYTDHEFPEGASAELRSGDVAHGEMVVERALMRVVRHMAEGEKAEEWGRDVRLLKKAVSFSPNGMMVYSQGYHHNYNMSRQAFYGLFRRFAVPFIISRNVLDGAGCWMSTTDGELDHVLTGQKVQTAEVVFNQSTTGQKPLFNTREEPHADGSRWARWHDVSVDPGMYPKNLWRAVNSTSAAIRLVELDLIKRDEIPVVDDPLQAVRAWLSGPEHKVDITLPNDPERRRRWSQLDLREWYQDMTEERLLLRGVLPEVEELAVAKVREVIDQYRRDRWELAKSRDVQWLHLKWLVSDTIARLNAKELSVAEKRDRLAMLSDFSVMLVEPDDQGNYPAKAIGMRERQRRGLDFPGYDPQRVGYLMFNPPTDTRAVNRVEVMRRINPDDYGDLGFQLRADWEHIKFGGTILWRDLDPRGSNTELVQTILN